MHVFLGVDKIKSELSRRQKARKRRKETQDLDDTKMSNGFSMSSYQHILNIWIFLQMHTILKSNLFFITCLICQIYYSWLDFKWLITAKAGQGGTFTEPMLEPMLTGVSSRPSV